ncbi:MAG: hypothetical protein JWQ04_1567 [Pedosphaera sp.]|nr:hypothetical protein [Pedosphaera sp.]
MTPEAPPQIPKKGHGCFFYGCITSLVLLLLVILGGYLAVHFTIKRVQAMVAEYTDTSPVALPKVEMSADEVKKLKARVAAFSQAVEAHSNAVPLVLTGPELNALLAGNPDAKEFRDAVYVSLEGEAIKGQVSLPLDALDNVPGIHMFHLKGRYLNGAAVFNAGITNDTLSVHIKSLEAKGKPLPAEFLSFFKQQNLAEGANQGTNAAIFERYESIQVKDSTLIITPKKD